jgi:hypothetical protein
MISQARLDANRRNAKQSTGPRTQEGKRRSSGNAITHGMTARFALLPDEDEAAFDRRMFEWVRKYGPRNDGELFQAERAAYCSWLVERARRAQSARLVFKAQTALDEKRIREEREYAEFALRLFRLPGGGQSGKGETHGNREQQEGLPGLCGIGGRDNSEHPAQLVLALEAIEAGCRWLLGRWNELKAVIEDERLAWQAPERFKAIRLLGIDSRDVMDAPAVIAILQACEMLDPDAGGLVDGFRNELPAANASWSMEQLREWVPEMSLPADQAAARQELAEIVNSHTERLELKLKEHEEIGDLKAKYAAHDLAFDHSPEGERMRRYETTCNRYVDRYFSELTKRMSNNAGNRYAPAPLTYTRPRPQVFRETDGPSESAEITALIDEIRKSSSKSEIRNPKRDEENGTCGDGRRELRNEATGAGASSSKSEIRNPKGDEENGSCGDGRRELRNDATGAGASSSKSEIRNPKGDEENGSCGDGRRELRNDATGAGASSSKFRNSKSERWGTERAQS